jgi:hypothetical protein
MLRYLNIIHVVVDFGKTGIHFINIPVHRVIQRILSGNAPTVACATSTAAPPGAIDVCDLTFLLTVTYVAP